MYSIVKQPELSSDFSFPRKRETSISEEFRILGILFVLLLFLLFLIIVAWDYYGDAISKAYMPRLQASFEEDMKNEEERKEDTKVIDEYRAFYSSLPTFFFEKYPKKTKKT